ncbi:hypothetical protein L1887_02482 [Cichorium endivia]|nr:hypothetical protein L1887_02482 [Cichorium endivia]
MAATIRKNEKLVEVKNEGDEQNEVSKSEAEAKEGVQKKRGRKPNNGNTGTAIKSQEKIIKPRGRPKKAVTTQEEMTMKIGVVKSNDDGNKSPEETEEGMVDAETALATPVREGNGTNEALNNKEGTIENERPAFKSTRKDGLKSKLHVDNKVPDETVISCSCVPGSSILESCIKVALDFVSPENVGECIRLTEDFRLLPQNHKAKEDNLEVKKLALYAMKAAVEDLEKIVPK